MTVHYLVDLVRIHVVVASTTCWVSPEALTGWGNKKHTTSGCELRVVDGGPAILRVHFGIGVEPRSWHIERADLLIE